MTLLCLLPALWARRQARGRSFASWGWRSRRWPVPWRTARAGTRFPAC
ncbi:MAG: hypothetical protein ACLUI3_09460 [Christensenellales bacterium]